MRTFALTGAITIAGGALGWFNAAFAAQADVIMLVALATGIGAALLVDHRHEPAHVHAQRHAHDG